MYDVMKDILMSEKEFTGTNYKRYEFDRMYIDKKLIEDQLYQIKYQFNEKKTTSTKFYSIPLNKMHPLYDGNSRTCNILFANDDVIRQNI